MLRWGTQGDEGGGIRLTTRTEGDLVFVAVEDSGCGIADQDLKRIFDPGYTTKGVGVGTGLGLAISYRIVSRHRGHIRVESQVGSGSTFTVVLPRHLERLGTVST